MPNKVTITCMWEASPLLDLIRGPIKAPPRHLKYGAPKLHIYVHVHVLTKQNKQQSLRTCSAVQLGKNLAMFFIKRLYAD